MRQNMGPARFAALEGSTLAALRRYIEGNGGKVVGASTLATTSTISTGYGGHLAIRPAVLRNLRQRFDPHHLDEYYSPNMASRQPTSSPTPKRVTSPVSARLTPSEINSLQQDKSSALAELRALYRKRKGKTP